jgi:hypothetical protein
VDGIPPTGPPNSIRSIAGVISPWDWREPELDSIWLQLARVLIDDAWGCPVRVTGARRPALVLASGGRTGTSTPPGNVGRRRCGDAAVFEVLPGVAGIEEVFATLPRPHCVVWALPPRRRRPPLRRAGLIEPCRDAEGGRMGTTRPRDILEGDRNARWENVGWQAP